MPPGPENSLLLRHLEVQNGDSCKQDDNKIVIVQMLE